MKIITIVNQKGGVGKTTTAVSLGAALAEQGKRVLIVDLDPQRSATIMLHGGEYHGSNAIADLIYDFIRQRPMEYPDYILHSDKENVDYIPSVPDLASAPANLANHRNSSTVLAKILHDDFFQSHYDVILIDDKPSLDLLVVNSLVAATELLVPLQPEDLAIEGLADLWDTIEQIRESYNDKLYINGILLSRANMQRKKAKDNLASLRDTFQNLVYDTTIPDWADIGNALDEGVTVLQLKRSKMGGLYRKLAQEVMSR